MHAAKVHAAVRLESMYRGVAQSGSASGLGPEGRRFESYRPDHSEKRPDGPFFMVTARSSVG